MITEFTKEELESILNWGDVYTEFGSCWTSKLHKPLMDKIQLMIDNYCEHEWDDAATNQFYCVKCQKHIDKI